MMQCSFTIVASLLVSPKVVIMHSYGLRNLSYQYYYILDHSGHMSPTVFNIGNLHGPYL